MLVVVVTVVGVPVAVMDVVHVVVMRHLVVPAAGAVLVRMTRMSQVRQRVLVIVPLVRSMRVTLVHVVDMPFALHARVTATGAMLVAVVRVRVMIGGCQGSLEPRTEAAGIPLFLSSPGDLRPNRHDTAPQKRGIRASCQKVNTVHVPGHI